MSALPRELSLRLASAAAVLLGPLCVWAAGLPREVYTAAWILGAALALALAARIPRAAAVPTLALAFAALCASLALGDLLLRTALAERLFPRPVATSSLRWPVNPELSRYQPDVRFTGATFGDLAAATGRVADREMREITFSTDDRGFRNPPPLPEGALDVVLLGDSFGVGTSTSDEEIWLSQLRRRGLAVYSLCAPGSPWGELITLKTEISGLALRPGTTVLWAVFTGNDLDDRYRDELEPPPPNGPLARAGARFASFRRRSPLRRLWEGRFEPGLQVERAAHDARFLYLRQYQESSRRNLAEVKAHGNYPRLARVFASMAELSRQRALRVQVVAIPTKWETYAWLLDPARRAESEAPSGFAVAVEALARENGFAFLDLKPALVAEARLAWQGGGYVFWRDDTHWNGRGQRVATDAVAPLLVQ